MQGKEGPPVEPELNAAGNPKSIMVDTTVGRIIFNDVLPESIPFQNLGMDRPSLRKVVRLCYRTLGGEATAEVVDRIKNTGFSTSPPGAASP